MTIPVQPSVSASFSAIPDRNRLNFSWLMTLRFAELAGQTATILGVEWLLDIPVPLLPLFVIVGVGLLSNLACVLWLSREPLVAEWHLAAIMALDVALLTALLYFTGGPQNPFSFLYLVQIALAAVVLRAHWTWMLTALSLGSFGILLVTSRELAVLYDTSVHHQGMWVALGVASAFIVYFLLRIVGALAERERELSEVRQRSARQKRLTSLATMAAGAAHELATPLSTVALVAKELERALDKRGESVMAEDARLIREQVGRCRMILDQMAGGAGEHPGEGIASLTVSELLAEAMVGARAKPPVRFELPDDVASLVVRLPPRAMAQALRSLITNAQDASLHDTDVAITGRRRTDGVLIDVVDRGPGMSPEVLERVGEPFFTTKEPGHGMGLGLFLTRAVVESLGGTLQLRSSHGRGTVASVTLPLRFHADVRSERDSQEGS